MRLKLVAGTALLLGMGSCVANPDFSSGDQLEQFLTAFEQQSEQAKIDRSQQMAREIKRLDIHGPPERLRLSVDLQNAPLDEVMSRILSDPRLSFRADQIQFSGRVSARFSQLPMDTALNLLLADDGIHAGYDGSILTFGYGADRSFQAKLDASEGGTNVTNFESREIAIHNLASEDVVELISDLFDSDSDDESHRLTVGSVSELNAVYVAGSPEKVAEARRIIAQADRPVAHVIIEALVVNINTSSVESLGISLTDGESGQFSAIDIVPGQTGGNVVATFSDLAANSAAVTATIDFLAAQNAAEVLARPYVATRSTRPATIQIVDDQFARVDANSDDLSIITTDSITAGISMEITPIVMADEAIRLDLTLEDSRFSATAGDIIIAKERSAATTSMIVQSGQTIVIGGLNSRYRITENSGLPWLRHIPILNLIAGEQGAIEARSELVVYLTPYIWMPGLEIPLPLPGEPDSELPDLIGFEAPDLPWK